MLHGVRFLCSAVAAIARLAHALIGMALMSLCCCSPTSSSSTVVPAPAPCCWQTQARPPAGKKRAHHHHPPAGVEDKDHHQLLPLLHVEPPPPPHHDPAPPPVPLVKAEKKAKAATRGRPPRLVIPPPPARAAGVDPFGQVAADRETDVATEVEVRGEGFCLASRRGARHAMEDGYGVITAAAADDGIGGGSQLAFYGVYDGHGGRAAVDFVADKLGKNVLAAAAAASRLQEGGGDDDDDDDDEVVMAAAIRSAYLTTDSEFLNQGVRGGACAATALVKDGELYVANVGDCRAVLGSRGGVATALTTDHTAGREDERRRIEASGGYVSRGSSGVWRVQDSLAVTRAFGDASVKPWGVTGEPEVSRRRITPDCRFLVLASDGLWDKVSCQEAVDAVFNAATADGTTTASVGPCKDLVAMARSRGSRDDVTVMIVDLQRFLLHAPVYDE